ncbi:hypothetical protein GLR19_004957 [Escherichia coli]|nr:hypothetical protein [Escherichia coli]EFL8773233.1 hypothetical protein [Escherichia coli]EJP6931126.1 hypothetical protein [Escherichia coli]ELV4169319.1 hypothetical protein [Escherichia coli]
MTLFFCKEMPPYKDVEQKTTTIIIFLILTALKTTSYHHDDDDKITKMRLFPRPPAPCSGPPHQEDPQNDNGYHLQQNPVSSTIAPDWRL